MKKAKSTFSPLTGLLLCATLIAGCTSYVVRGNAGGPDGGGVRSPDGERIAFVTVAVSDQYKDDEQSPHLARVWLADAKTFKLIKEKKFQVDGYYVEWKVTWRDSLTAEFELYDHGSAVLDPVQAATASANLRRVLTTQTLIDR